MKIYRCDLCNCECKQKEAIPFKLGIIKVEHLCKDCMNFLTMCMDLFKLKEHGKQFALDVIKSHKRLFPKDHEKKKG